MISVWNTDRWRTAQYFISRYDHLFFVFDDIEKYNEISGSMTLTVGAIIEFANETRDDTTRAIDSAELSLKKASYSGPSMPREKHAVQRLRQTKPLWNGEHNRYGQTERIEKAGRGLSREAQCRWQFSEVKMFCRRI